jgi:cell division ATPase FtsA
VIVLAGFKDARAMAGHSAIEAIADKMEIFLETAERIL